MVGTSVVCCCHLFLMKIVKKPSEFKIYRMLVDLIECVLEDKNDLLVILVAQDSFPQIQHIILPLIQTLL